MRDWQWKKARGASWRRPFGELLPDYTVTPQQPATQVSWRDADAYCRWAKKRLPTEVEWEVAMSAGAHTRYPWGSHPKLDGVARLNHWQGRADGDEHEVAVVDDGHLYLSPVRTYPPNALGIYDPVGNVWQITDTWYDADAFADEARAGVVVDPTGPRHGKQKVARGGSWWCSARTCQGFGLWYRGKNDVDAPFNNVGFRCAADAPRPPEHQP